LNSRFHQAKEAEKTIVALRERVVVLETLGAVLPHVPVEHDKPSDGKSLAAQDAKIKGRKGKPAAPPDKVFVPCGTDPTVPPYLRLAETMHQCPVRALTLSQTLSLIFDAWQFHALWLFDMDPPRPLDRRPPVSVSPPMQSATSSDAHSEWLRFVHKQAKQARQKLAHGLAHGAKEAVMSTPPQPTEHWDQVAPFTADISIELSYSLIYHCQDVYPDNPFCRLFLLQLGGDVPRDAFVHLRRRCADLRDTFEALDPHFTEGVVTMEAAQEIRRRFPDYAEQQAGALGELVEELQSSESSPHSRHRFACLLVPTGRFMTCVAAFFLAQLEASIDRLTVAIRQAAAAASTIGKGTERGDSAEGFLEEVTATSVIATIQQADPYSSQDVVKAFVDQCAGAITTRATRLPVERMLRRVREVFYQRATPTEYRPLTCLHQDDASAPTRLPMSTWKVAVELTITNVGAKGGKQVRPALVRGK